MHTPAAHTKLGISHLHTALAQLPSPHPFSAHDQTARHSHKYSHALPTGCRVQCVDCVGYLPDTRLSGIVTWRVRGSHWGVLGCLYAMAGHAVRLQGGWVGEGPRALT